MLHLRECSANHNARKFEASGDNNLPPPPNKYMSSKNLYDFSFKQKAVVWLCVVYPVFLKREMCSFTSREKEKTSTPTGLLYTNISSVSMFLKLKCPVAVSPKPLVVFVNIIIVLVLVIKAHHLTHQRNRHWLCRFTWLIGHVLQTADWA